LNKKITAMVVLFVMLVSMVYFSVPATTAAPSSGNIGVGFVTVSATGIPGYTPPPPPLSTISVTVTSVGNGSYGVYLNQSFSVTGTVTGYDSTVDSTVLYLQIYSLSPGATPGAALVSPICAATTTFDPTTADKNGNISFAFFGITATTAVASAGPYYFAQVSTQRLYGYAGAANGTSNTAAYFNFSISAFPYYLYLSNISFASGTFIWVYVYKNYVYTGGVLVTAIYNKSDNLLKEVVFTTMPDIYVGELNYVAVYTKTTVDDSCYVKVFIWDTEANAVPISNVYQQ